MIYTHLKYFALLFITGIMTLCPKPGLCQAHKPTMHALIIAISNYAGGSDWWALNSDNDADLVKTTLDSIGFKDHVTVLPEQACTREGIIKALRTLKNNVTASDIVLIHYSGHGVQIEADKDVDQQVDKLDECWVPKDAHLPAGPWEFDQKKDKYLRGYEIENLLDSIRLKLGPKGDLLVLVDACCSAGSTSGARGLGVGINRGLDVPLHSEKFTYHRNADKILFKNATSAKKQDKMCPYVMIAAARAQESDMEISVNNKNYGPLSYSFVKAISTLGSSKITYTELYESIRLAMNIASPNQLPEIEGTGQNRNIFGGQDVGRKNYFRITAWNNDHLIIDAGSIHGITTGSKIAIYPLKWLSDHASAKLIEGTVDSAYLFHSSIKLNGTTLPKTAVAALDTFAAIAVLDTLNTDNIKRITIKIIDDSNNVAKKIKKHFSNNSFVDFNGKPDVDYLILQPTEGNEWNLKVWNGELFKDHIRLDNDETMKRIDSAITDYARYVYLENLNINKDTALRVKVELVRLVNGRPDSISFSASDLGRQLSLDTGAEVAIHIINTGKDSAYVNLVDMQPDGQMATILPHAEPGGENDYPVGKCMLPPGRESYFYAKNPFVVGPPFGNEIIKVFLTKQEMDLENVIKTRGARGIGPTLNTIGKLFQNSFEIPRTRGGLYRDVNANASLDDGTIYSILFEISDPAKKATAGKN